jgi:hypothetical protein
MKWMLIIGVVMAGTAALAQGDRPAAAKKAAEGEAPPPNLSKMTLTPESIRRVMSYHQPKIQECYEEFLRGRDKPIDGKLMTSFVVTPDGLVEKPEVAKKGTTLRDPKLHECVVSALSGIEFPKPKDGKAQPIEYPFNLKSVK